MVTTVEMPAAYLFQYTVPSVALWRGISEGYAALNATRYRDRRIQELF